MIACLKLIPAALIALSMSAQAAVIITIQEVGQDVVVSGSGSIASDWLGGPVPTQIFSTDILDPSNYTIQAGNPTTEMNLYELQAIPGDPETNEPRFGNGPEVTQTTNNTGDAFGIRFSQPELMQLAIPTDYVSGEQMNFRVTFPGATLNSLGIELGSSTWNWTGQPELDQHVTLNVIPRAGTPPVAASSVPTLGALGLMGLAAAIGTAGVAMTRRRKQS